MGLNESVRVCLSAVKATRVRCATQQPADKSHMDYVDGHGNIAEWVIAGLCEGLESKSGVHERAVYLTYPQGCRTWPDISSIPFHNR